MSRKGEQYPLEAAGDILSGTPVPELRRHRRVTLVTLLLDAPEKIAGFLARTSAFAKPSRTVVRWSGTLVTAEVAAPERASTTRKRTFVRVAGAAEAARSAPINLDVPTAVLKTRAAKLCGARLRC